MDFSSYWALYNRHKARGGQLLVIFVALVVGWQLGRTTSPYYDARPIVFEDTACEAGAPEELVELKNEGEAQRVQAAKKEEVKEGKKVPANTSKPVVAGAKNDVAAAGKFVGSVNSDLFHDPSCSSSKRIKDSNQVWFDSIEDAEKSGYSPSKCTQKLLGL